VAEQGDVYRELWSAIDHMGAAAGAMTGLGTSCHRTADTVVRTIEELRTRLAAAERARAEAEARATRWERVAEDFATEAILRRAELGYEPDPRVRGLQSVTIDKLARADRPFSAAPGIGNIESIRALARERIKAAHPSPASRDAETTTTETTRDGR
jgi:hypothetical protein